MGFWGELLVGFLANVLAGFLFVGLYVMFQWFLQATDVTVRYNWTQNGAGCHPNFDIRNRSKSRSYFLANVEYRKGDTVAPLDIDNRSVWGKELKPGTIESFEEVASVKHITSLAECTEVKVSVRLQNGRKFWLKAPGPGQMSMSLGQRIAFWVRDKSEGLAFPFE